MNQKKKAAVGRPPTLDDARATILAHAGRLFAEKGFEQTSLADVGKSLGVSKAAVYHYFTSKQDIYDEIVVGLLDGLYAFVVASLEEAPADRDPLEVFMFSHAHYFDTNFSAFLTLFHGMGGLDAQRRSEREVTIRDQYEILLRDILAEPHPTRPSISDDVAIVAKGVLSMLNWMSRWYRPGGPKTAIDVARVYYTMLTKGIGAAG